MSTSNRQSEDSTERRTMRVRLLIIKYWLAWPWSQLWRRWHYRGLPSDLQKACEDYFEYAIGLKDGTVFYFAQADRQGGWLLLSEVRGHSARALQYPSEWRQECDFFNFDRGVQVRIADIAWIADAPFGS